MMTLSRTFLLAYMANKAATSGAHKVSEQRSLQRPSIARYKRHVTRQAHMMIKFLCHSCNFVAIILLIFTSYLCKDLCSDTLCAPLVAALIRHVSEKKGSTQGHHSGGQWVSCSGCAGGPCSPVTFT